MLKGGHLKNFGVRLTTKANLGLDFVFRFFARDQMINAPQNLQRKQQRLHRYVQHRTNTQGQDKEGDTTAKPTLRS